MLQNKVNALAGQSGQLLPNFTSTFTQFFYDLARVAGKLSEIFYAYLSLLWLREATFVGVFSISQLREAT